MNLGTSLFPELAAYVSERRAEMGSVPDRRRAELELLARFIKERERAGETTKLVFICTHNSRRSHLAQVWAQTAAHVYGVTGFETYSGGTEATAFNPRAVAALQRAGFRIDGQAEAENPVYRVSYTADKAPMECFSKVHDQPPNPRQGFCAVMTCSAAEAACPVVFGATHRIAIRYDDPKEFDGSPLEQAKYDERCRQIAREMLYALSCVATERR
jgi:arsenate reductase